MVYRWARVLLAVALLLPLAPPLAARAATRSESPSWPVASRDRSQRVVPGEVPAGLSAAEWASIQGQIAAGRYRARPAEGGGYRATNPAQGWQIGYGADGTTELRPHEGGGAPWAWGLRLTGYGYARLVPVGRPQVLLADGERLSYAWDATLSEWWINRATGLEQGFTLRQRPAGASAGQPLRLELTLSGGLRASQRGNALTFHDAGGTALLTYDKLHVWDATGRVLPARLHLAEGRLTILVDDAAASYPLTIDPTVQQAYLKASNAGADDFFGWSVAISGETAVVGAKLEDGNGSGGEGNDAAPNAGAAYVFVRSGSNWSQQAYLKASNVGAGDQFGVSVAISGETIVVGAYQEASSATGGEGDNSATAAGAAYVFVRSGSNWSQQAYLKASNAGAGDQFGYAVAISGETIVVGAHHEDSNATGGEGDNSATNAGAAYVFVRSGNAWSQQAYLKASNTEGGDQFGISVGISGDTVVVGAWGEDGSATGGESNNSATNAGAAYIFTRSGSAWSQQARLKASNAEANDFFGEAVAISGETVVVGAWGEDSSATGGESDNSASESGAAYAFTRNGSVWSQQARLKASNAEANDQVGYAVAISGETVVLGAAGEDSSAMGSEGDNSVSAAGAAYVFTRNGSDWSQLARLKASNAGAGDEFGYAVGISGGTVVVGARWEDSNGSGGEGNNSALSAGAAYTFLMTGPNLVTVTRFAAAEGRAPVSAALLALGGLLTLGLLARRHRR